ncbi:myb-like protein L isoform X2 [Rhizophagus clarus]|uniref:Myb-like protein L isoform X2 n=1 Tax=Rhizophagus clarus TaxID=94130 RepID=A0A8H3LGC4_9GLOM|nr:myb-like protein L isoform X2 [Rhizophagus clarus]
MEKDIIEVLKYNRELQANLQKKIAAVEAAIARNINLQNKLKHLKNNQFSSETKIKDFGPPFFVDIYGNTPPKNDDIQLRERPKKFKPIKWIQQEKDALAQGVYDQNFRRECLKAMQSNQFLDTVLEKDSQYFLINVEGLDWCELSKQYVQNKTPEECIIQWTTHEHPSINKSEWTAAETRKLRQIASRYNNRNWQRIATELNTNRTAADCFKQWNKQTSGPRKWTKEEDEILARAVDLYGEKNWQQIADGKQKRMKL